jgi:phage shock protein A
MMLENHTRNAPAEQLFGAMPKAFDRAAWGAAMAEFQQLKREADELYERTELADQAFFAARDAVPHVTVDVPGQEPLSTENEALGRWIRSCVDDLRSLEDLPGKYDHYRAYHRLIEADEARKAQIQRLDELHGWSAAHDAYDEAMSRQMKAERVLLDTPAPDGEALMWKVAQLYTPGDGIWEPSVEQQTHTDLRRFLLGGRA